MGWYGKVIGALLGAIVGRGLFGALIGFLIGHLFDRLSRPVPPPGSAAPRDLQSVFFRATFQVMGHLAKADGRVTEQEIDAARAAMRRFSLGEDDVHRAIDLFTEGKDAGFPLDATLGELRSASAGRDDLRRLFVQIQLETSLQGGGLSSPARAIFGRLCNALEISAIEFAALEAMLRMRGQTGPGAGAGAGHASPAAPDRLADAYRVMGVSPDARDAEVRLAYRRLVSRNHPDKLVASGLPPSMIEAAHERTRRILEAYEIIRKHRGMK